MGRGDGHRPKVDQVRAATEIYARRLIVSLIVATDSRACVKERREYRRRLMSRGLFRAALPAGSFVGREKESRGSFFLSLSR